MRAVLACAVILAGRGWAADVDGALKALAGYRVGDTVAVTRSVEGLLRDPAARSDVVRGLAAMLFSAATEDAKRYALEQLAIAGSAAEVPAIAELLPDPVLTDPARRALERIPGPEATTALLAAVDSLSGTPLAGVAAALGERQDPAAVPVLARLMRGSDTIVATSAARALGRICDAAAVEALTEGRSASPAVRVAIADASLECADALKGSRREKAVGIWRVLDAAGGLGRVRGAALLGLTSGGGGRAMSLALKYLSDPDAEVVAAALRAVREMPGPVPADLLKTEFRKLPAADQAPFVEALGWRPDSAGLTVAVEAAGSEDDDVRLAGLRALGRVGDASSILLLAKASATLSGDAQDAARESLDALPGATVDAAIIAQIKGGNPHVRAELVRSLGARGRAEAVPVIEAATRDSAAVVQLEAARALGVLAKESSRAPLIALVLATPDDEVRKAAAKSAAEIVRGVPIISVTMVLGALNGAGPAARGAMLSILPAVGGRRALAAARSDLGNADPEVGKAAVRALGDWPSPEPATDLLRIAQSDTDTGRRVLALRGCVRLAGLPTDRPAKETAATFAAILAAAPRPEDTKVVLAGLAKVPDPAALDLAVSKLSDPAVRDEAVSAVVAIASELKASHPEEVAAALGRAIEAGAKGKTANKAKELLTELEKGADFVTAWEVAGPFRADGVSDEELLDHAFPPEDPKAAGVEWKAPARDPESEKPWQVDLLYAVGGEHCATYLRTYLWSPAKTKVRFEIGSDDGVKIWLNGKVIHANNAKRPVEDGEDKAEAKLQKGWNPVLVKVTQGDGGWGFSLRVRTSDGKKVEGLKARTKPVDHAP